MTNQVNLEKRILAQNRLHVIMKNQPRVTALNFSSLNFQIKWVIGITLSHILIQTRWDLTILVILYPVWLQACISMANGISCK